MRSIANLVRIWVAKYEAGSFDSDVVAADIVQTQEARIAALERLVGKLVLENEFLKGALPVKNHFAKSAGRLALPEPADFGRQHHCAVGKPSRRSARSASAFVRGWLRGVDLL